jgi:hypothetical protein
MSARGSQTNCATPTDAQEMGPRPDPWNGLRTVSPSGSTRSDPPRLPGLRDNPPSTTATDLVSRRGSWQSAPPWRGSHRSMILRAKHCPGKGELLVNTRLPMSQHNPVVLVVEVGNRGAWSTSAREAEAEGRPVRHNAVDIHAPAARHSSPLKTTEIRSWPRRVAPSTATPAVRT